MSPAPTVHTRRRSSLRLYRQYRLHRLGPVVLALWVNACSSWHPIDLAPTREFRPSQELRIQLGEDQLTLSEARMVGDTLVGQHTRSARFVRAPLADIQRAEALKLDKGRTLLAMGIVVGVIAIVVGGALADPGSWTY